MPEVPQLGRGATLAYKTTSGGTFNTIGNVVSVEGPNITVGEVEATILTSTFKPYLPTLPEGEVTLNVRHIGFDPAVQALRAMVATAPVPVLYWMLTYEDTSTDAFQGFPKGYSISGIENETIVDASIPIRLTTAVTPTYPTS
jgi:hypothetical protein